MKKIIALSFGSLLLAALITISSCNNEPLIVTYSLADKDVCLPANPNVAYYIDSFTINHNDLTAALTSAGITDFTRATSAKLKSGIKFVITGGNLDEIGNVEVYLKVAGTSGVGDQIAYSDVLAPGVTEGVLKINGTELKQALANDMTLTIKVLNKTGGNTAKCYKLTSGVIEISVRK